ncbi:hypothetical protein [Methanobacterium aggregans]|uniref:hypothetical protein n=1 Tax=Methanobacterium aggregans TaxID=1615586 RepID=UPI001AE6A07B|nr:hypothetical protein [Methanobacterium aggregans]MBP2045762.1 Ribonuclease G/E [Methanobacterium aggregans]
MDINNQTVRKEAETDSNVTADEIYQDLKNDYEGVEKVTLKDKNVFCIYADDDTLWQIFEDIMDGVTSIEFNAGANEAHYLEIIP